MARARGVAPIRLAPARRVTCRCSTDCLMRAVALRALPSRCTPGDRTPLCPSPQPDLAARGRPRTAGPTSQRGADLAPRARPRSADPTSQRGPDLAARARPRSAGPTSQRGPDLAARARPRSADPTSQRGPDLAARARPRSAGPTSQPTHPGFSHRCPRSDLGRRTTTAKGGNGGRPPFSLHRRGRELAK